jgi:hypothetical protein
MPLKTKPRPEPNGATTRQPNKPTATRKNEPTAPRQTKRSHAASKAHQTKPLCANQRSRSQSKKRTHRAPSTKRSHGASNGRSATRARRTRFDPTDALTHPEPKRSHCRNRTTQPQFEKTNPLFRAHQIVATPPLPLSNAAVLSSYPNPGASVSSIFPP